MQIMILIIIYLMKLHKDTERDTRESRGKQFFMFIFSIIINIKFQLQPLIVKIMKIVNLV